MCQVSGGPKTYPLQIPVDYSLAVHVHQPSGDVPKLRESCKCRCRAKEALASEEHTWSSRLALAFAFRNMLMFPFSIHSDTITNRRPVIVTPTSGNTFG